MSVCMVPGFPARCCIFQECGLFHSVSVITCSLTLTWTGTEGGRRHAADTRREGNGTTGVYGAKEGQIVTRNKCKRKMREEKITRI